MKDIYGIISQYTMIDFDRINSLSNAIDSVKKDNIPGDFVECGSWKCGTLGFMSLYSRSIGLQKKIHGFDSFEGMPEPIDIDGNDSRQWTGKLAVSIDEAYENLRAMNASGVTLHKGFFEKTLSQNKFSIDKISILRVDCDWYSSTKTCLEELYDLVSPNGFIIIDDYGHWQGCKKAVDEFRENRNISNNLFQTNYTEFWWRK